MTGANAGTIGTLLPAGFTGVENLQGGSAADTFAFGTSGSLTGTIAGGAGADTLVGNDAGLTFTVYRGRCRDDLDRATGRVHGRREPDRRGRGRHVRVHRRVL